MLSTVSAWSGQQGIASISDPSGDDFGDGALLYPQRSDFIAGDLDLLQLNVNRDEEGFWFEAKFRNTIRNPRNVSSSAGGESLENFARKGFYQFNLDIYIDTDRVQGSGNTFTLPGRQVRLAPSYGWERAVILSPRPELMRQQLLDAIAEQYPERIVTESEASINQAIFFPTRIRVRGKTIRFFVPAEFFSGSNGKDWGVTAFITGAITAIPSDLTLFPSAKKPLERLQLGVMQPESGHAVDTFGYLSRGLAPAPVVDLLGDTVEAQIQQLAAKGELAGVYWGRERNMHAADMIEVKAVAQDAGLSSGIVVSQITPVSALLNPQDALNLPSQINPQVAVPTAEPVIAQRLQTLQQLYDQKLVSEAEYQEQRRRILEEL